MAGDTTVKIHQCSSQRAFIPWPAAGWRLCIYLVSSPLHHRSLAAHCPGETLTLTASSPQLLCSGPGHREICCSISLKNVPNNEWSCVTVHTGVGTPRTRHDTVLVPVNSDCHRNSVTDFWLGHLLL